jgi:hypothetical protein
MFLFTLEESRRVPRPPSSSSSQSYYPSTSPRLSELPWIFPRRIPLASLGPATWFAVWAHDDHQRWRLLQIGGTAFPRAATDSYNTLARQGAAGVVQSRMDRGSPGGGGPRVVLCERLFLGPCHEDTVGAVVRKQDEVLTPVPSFTAVGCGQGRVFLGVVTHHRGDSDVPRSAFPNVPSHLDDGPDAAGLIRRLGARGLTHRRPTPVLGNRRLIHTLPIPRRRLDHWKASASSSSASYPANPTFMTRHPPHHQPCQDVVAWSTSTCWAQPRFPSARPRCWSLQVKMGHLYLSDPIGWPLFSNFFLLL